MSATAAPTARKRFSAPELTRTQNLILTIAFVVVFALLPFALEEGGLWMNVLVLGAAFTVMALGLNIIVGFAGLLDLGYVAFFAIGAYTMGYFGSGFWSNAGGGEGPSVYSKRTSVKFNSPKKFYSVFFF